MKKYLFALIIQVVTSISFISAQSNHMMFRNVPIDGSLISFIHKMEKQGFVLTYINEDDTYAIMSGTFVNNDCVLYIGGTPKTQKVYQVAVELPEDNDWYSLKYDYFKYKKEFREKYGIEDVSHEFILKPYYEGDGYELQAIKEEKCTYASYFETPYGTIVVYMAKSTPNIKFAYEDRINGELKDKEMKDKIQDDI